PSEDARRARQRDLQLSFAHRPLIPATTMRSLIQRGMLALGAVIGLLGSRPATANAQKALVYCPVTIDATGCNAIVSALTGPAYPLGVDRGYDGTDGTVDLKAVDLISYSVFVVPSLADGAASQPY